ncbi:MAG: SRPBCC domain-containing protein [Calditrichaceae bacterium]
MKWLLRIGIGVVILIFAAFMVMFVWSGAAKGIGHSEIKIQIDRPAAEVFEWITDTDKLKSWMEGFVEEKPLNGDSLRIGARSMLIIEYDEQIYEMEMEITDLEINRLLEVKISAIGWDETSRYVLNESDGSTTLLFKDETQYKHTFAKLMEPLITLSARNHFQKNFTRLKTLAESAEM